MNNNTHTSNLPQTTTTTTAKQAIPQRNTPTNGTNTPIPTKGTTTSTETSTETKTTKNTSIDEKIVLSPSTKLVSSDTDTVLLHNRYHPTDNIKNSTMSEDGHDATVDELPSPPKSSNTTTSNNNYNNNNNNNYNYAVVIRSLAVSCFGYLYHWLVVAPVNIFGYIAVVVAGKQPITSDSQQQQQQQQRTNGNNNTITSTIVNSKQNSTTTTSSQHPESKSQQKINGGKYIPPQLRRGGGSGGGGKYIPPHRRNQMEAEQQQQQPPPQPQDPVVVVTAAIQKPHSASSIHHHRPPSKRLGGCADPTLIRGSICDTMYIPKKASEVGSKVHSESFGSFGGLPSSSRHCGSENGTKQTTNDDTNSNIQWEVGAVSKCGLRSSNEDSYIVVNDLSVSSSSSSSSSSTTTTDTSNSNRKGEFESAMDRLRTTKEEYERIGKEILDWDEKEKEEEVQRAATTNTNTNGKKRDSGGDDSSGGGGGMFGMFRRATGFRSRVQLSERRTILKRRVEIMERALPPLSSFEGDGVEKGENTVVRSSDGVIFEKEGYMTVKRYGGLLGTREEYHIVGKFLITEILDSATTT